MIILLNLGGTIQVLTAFGLGYAMDRALSLVLRRRLVVSVFRTGV
jgi:hypothetical protein